jgi:hypothetical protein
VECLNFDGLAGYAQVADSPDLSVATTGALTVAAFIRPAALSFPHIEGTRYVHWMGKGEPGRHECVLRMYSKFNSENRANRISFYVFNQEGHRGVGAYVQEWVTPGLWIHIAGVADGERINLFENGILKNTQRYADDVNRGAGRLRCAWVLGISAAGEISRVADGSAVTRTGLVAEYLFTAGRDTAREHDAAVKGATWGADDSGSANAKLLLHKGEIE